MCQRVDMTKNRTPFARLRVGMSDEVPKQRDLDHLMEQNATELDFLSAYGGTSLEGDGAPLLSALMRFLKAGNITVTTVNKNEITFPFGTASVVENGCLVIVECPGLPLVPSDVQQAGFAHGALNQERNRCEVVMIDWGFEQRRFIERVSEHFTHGE